MSDPTPSNSKSNEQDVRMLANLFWKFHNDRLTDPSVNDMTPYIQPILDHYISKEDVLGAMEEQPDILFDPKLKDRAYRTQTHVDYGNARKRNELRTSILKQLNLTKEE